METGSPPARWLTRHRELLPTGGEALDVACGRGRHALWLAAVGFVTLAIDRDPEAVTAVRRAAAVRGLPVTAEVRDFEHGAPDLPTERFAVVVAVHYLHRPLMPALVAAVAPGGVLVYETFTRAQAARGRPTNPAFLLEAGELPGLTHPLEVLRSREGEFEGRMVASVIARRPPG
jgi:2-polyprenyl-3-methyl-5-hydroxy-6-metoxy-1,4-benzoquinol methylase